MHKLLRNIFRASLDELLAVEREHILTKVSERNLCARLACIIERNAHQEGFTQYFADVEYNRKQGGEVKTIFDDIGEKKITITPDLILHARGSINAEKENLIVVEMKWMQNSDNQKNENDRLRLKILTRPLDKVYPTDGSVNPKHVCGYQLGFFVLLDINNKTCAIEEYSTGKMINGFIEKL